MKLPIRVKKITTSNSLCAPGAIDDTEQRELSSLMPDQSGAIDSSVTLAVGMTENMGDFRSVKVFVSVTIPCANIATARRDAIEQGSAEMDYYLKREMPRAQKRFHDICR